MTQAIWFKYGTGVRSICSQFTARNIRFTRGGTDMNVLEGAVAETFVVIALIVDWRQNHVLDKFCIVKLTMIIILE